MSKIDDMRRAREEAAAKREGRKLPPREKSAPATDRRGGVQKPPPARPKGNTLRRGKSKA